jgi:hypothetical protein
MICIRALRSLAVKSRYLAAPGNEAVANRHALRRGGKIDTVL